MIKLGQEAKDKVTGFKGILTARCQYITGCDQYQISPAGLDSDNKLKELYQFDEGRIEILGPGIAEKEVQAKKKGGPQRISASIK